MRAILAACTLFATFALASPDGGFSLMTAEELEAEGFEIVDMQFHGAITPGGPEVSLTGTVESIYKQVLELNPDYDAWEFPEHVEYMASLGITKASSDAEMSDLLAGGNGLEVRQGSFDCSWGGRIGNWVTQCIEGLRYLRDLGTRWCGAGRGQCARVSCSHGCGMFLCNTHTQHLDVFCGDIQKDVTAISDNCGRSLGGQVWVVNGRRIFGSHYIGLGSQSC